MAAHEWLVVAYFSALIAAAWFFSITTAKRLAATVIGAVVLVVVAGASRETSTIRAWVPHLYLVAGYWMPALLVPPSSGSGFEEWLARTDVVVRRLLPSVPGPLIPVVELAYLLCYPLVPISFGVVWVAGGDADVDRFWLSVLAAGYACYGSLPWCVSRPPRRRQNAESDPRSALASMNSRLLRRVSHGLNTFPSGHAAVAATAAVSVATVSIPAGVAIGAVVVAISVGAAAGGYHYAVDVILGLAIAAAAVFMAGVV